MTKVHTEQGRVSWGGGQEYCNDKRVCIDTEVASWAPRGEGAGEGSGKEMFGRTGRQQSPPRSQQPSTLQDKGCPLHTARGGGGRGPDQGLTVNTSAAHRSLWGRRAKREGKVPSWPLRHPLLGYLLHFWPIGYKSRGSHDCLLRLDYF